MTKLTFLLVGLTALSFPLAFGQNGPAFETHAIRTEAPAPAQRIVATFTSIGEVRTRPGAGRLRIINDDELLAFAAPRIPALVRIGPHTQELIFLVPGEPDMGRVN